MQVRRFLVSGLVQGVYFRASTRAEAQRLGIIGYARNLPDGRVEVLAGGDEDKLQALEAWLWQGPPRARVDSVIVEESTQQPPQGFSIR